MKIRTGFVSNSSSASFIIDINHPMEEVLALLASGSELMDMWTLHTELENVVKRYDKEEMDDIAPWMRNFATQAKEMLGLYQTVKGPMGRDRLHLDFSAQKRLVEKYLAFRHQPLRETDTGCSVLSGTTIYNDLSDFGPIIKELIFLLTVGGFVFNWEIRDDQLPEEEEDDDKYWYIEERFEQ